MEDTNIPNQPLQEINQKLELNPEDLLNEGIADLNQKDFECAVKKLEKSLQIISAKKGELDPELYKYYYHYADGLLLQYESVQGDNLFGNEVQQAMEESIDEEDESGSSEQEESDVPIEENSENLNSNEGQNLESEQDESEEYSESEEEEAPEAGDEDKKDEFEDLQYIWENLEAARVILKMYNNDQEYLLKTYTRLGDAQNWKEDFNGACEEYSEALNILTQIEGATFSRKKAELYFLIGTCYLNTPGKEQQAAENFSKALEHLEQVKMRIFDYEVIKELSEIIDEIKLKIEDALEQEQSLKILKEDEENHPKDEVFPVSKIQTSEIKDLGVFGKRKRENTNPNQQDGECEKHPKINP